jgi:hypothetical protein
LSQAKYFLDAFNDKLLSKKDKENIEEVYREVETNFMNGHHSKAQASGECERLDFDQFESEAALFEFSMNKSIRMQHLEDNKALIRHLVVLSRDLKHLPEGDRYPFLEFRVFKLNYGLNQRRFAKPEFDSNLNAVLKQGFTIPFQSSPDSHMVREKLSRRWCDFTTSS